MTHYRFPEGFVWGTATSSYQIEGAAFEDGRMPSIWDTFCNRPGAIADGSTGLVADDHFHRYASDVALMAELGVNAYRFSIAWPRVLPNGTGQVNQKGLDFYSRLVDALLQQGITPFATLYHWDLPQVLSDRGGWTQRFIADAFAEYADVVSRALGDRVRHWATLNEPWVSSFVGYAIGDHAPGVKDHESYLRAGHHLLLAHGKAVPVLRANGSADTKVGLVNALSWATPASDSSEDKAAAARHMSFFNRWFLDPPLKGAYPQDIFDQLGGALIPVQPGDMEIIRAPLDFLGVNYYTRAIVAHDAEAPGLATRMLRNEGAEYTEMDWEVYPEGLYQLLMHMTSEYGLPMYITENGASFADELTDGEVHDARRTNYYQVHLAACARAIADGALLKGYFAWSLMDNFEWGHGYTKRFGLVYVDYATQERILKDSARWYAQAVKANGFELADG
jgi:beta-glucosidase